MSSIHNIVLFIEPDLVSHTSKIRYVLDWLEQHPLVPINGVKWYINPEISPESAIFIYYGFQNFENIPFFILSKKEIFTQTPTIKFSASNPLKPIKENENPQLEKDADWLEILFFMLSRHEEYHAKPEDLDEHGLMRSDAQWLVRINAHHSPLCDLLVVAIYQYLGLKPQTKPSGMTLSHDLDHVKIFNEKYNLVRNMGGVLMRYRNLKPVFRLLKYYLNKKSGTWRDPYDNLPWMLSQRTDIERIMYVPAIKYPYILDPDHLAFNEKGKEMMGFSKEKGYKIGLHPGYLTWKNADLMQEQKHDLEQWIGEKITFTRQHYLRFAFPETADQIQKLGFKEDSTLGYRDKIGFRCGTGFPYRLYDFTNQKAYDWYEKPLIVMDISLLRESKFDAKKIFTLWDDFKKNNANNTHITINFHNSVFFEPDISDFPLSELYQKMIN
jgi:hypothetical protein